MNIEYSTNIIFLMYINIVYNTYIYIVYTKRPTQYGID